MSVVVETKVGKKRVIVIPKAVAEAVKIREGQRIRIMAVGDRIVIEPIRDAVWLAIHGKKIGRIMPEELEEESILEQEKIYRRQ
ncbi:AbrB/MazE/SpoVT family DNA-binding domain-containing protein [Staphylothermus hellenicus]|uniref:Transcriptional regulator, AbrB family n=1 Tax=Staphylothermus hellenicus (strain DSM 12710 / JCM 10830 / BK20S6-10-b1 / P8) TaxID=591019 RepID=D7DBR3_STAHD|nr:AbrB/MazE/SpoVT family DNA-binding domain-containing protein [Staphylothermus hellenicus]ADI31610.1 transcriptional regulator, AbrB family [Staphylothermus hellenicus DSM 12710]